MENKDKLKYRIIKTKLSFRKASIMAFLFVIFYLGIALILSNQPQNCTIFCYAMISSLYLIVTLSLFYATLHSQKYGKRTQIAWGMLTLSVLFSTIASIIWAVIILYFNANPSTSIANIFYLMFFPLFLMGILIFPSSRVTNQQRFKGYFDIVIIIFSIFLVLWAFFISPAISLYQGDNLSLYFKLAYVAAGFLLLFSLLDLIFNRIKTEAQAPFLILFCAITVLVITDSIYAYQTIQGTYVSGSPIDFGWIIGYLIIGLAGVSQFTDQQIKLRKLSKYVSWHTNYHWTPYLAFAGVFIAYVLLIWAFNTSAPNLTFLEIGTGILILLVILRQIISIKENRRLYLNAEKEIDIRKKVEKSLKKSKATYKTIFENTGTATVIINENNTLSLTNTEFEKLSGYTKEELKGKKWSDFVKTNDTDNTNKNNSKNISKSNKKEYPQIISPSIKNFKSTEINRYEFQFLNNNQNLKDVIVIFALIPGTHKILASLLDVTDQKNAEKEIKKSLSEKEMLLKEIHHRVKNNLMVISSLLNLQASYINDKEHLEMFKESQSRAKSMALIHERLYQSKDLKRIDFGEYIDTLAIDMFHTYVSDPGKVHLNMNVETVLLDINTAIPLGLILNELLSNCMKYAFPDGRKGNIFIKFFKEGDTFSLIVKDDGIGIPKDIDHTNTHSLGLQLINNLTEQINGNLEVNSEKGTLFKITFPEEFH